jgi:multidrug efflux pump subunit AcrA (membrane-fusion protein)
MNVIYVDVGDRVKKGQVLATIEIPELKQELQQAAAVKRSEAEARHAQNEIERSESAHTAVHSAYIRLAAVLQSRPNLVAQQEIDDAQSRDRVGEAQIAAAKTALPKNRFRFQKPTWKEFRPCWITRKLPLPFRVS